MIFLAHYKQNVIFSSTSLLFNERTDKKINKQKNDQDEYSIILYLQNPTKMPLLNEAERSNAIGRLQAGKSLFIHS